MKDRYIFPALFSFKDSGIVVTFPDLPGVLSHGEDQEQAINSAKEALELHLYGMEEDGDEIPAPSKVSDIALEEGQAVVLVDAWMPALRDKLALKTVNQMTTLPKWLKDLADREKINFSQVLQSGLKDRLGVYDHRHREKKQRS